MTERPSDNRAIAQAFRESREQWFTSQGELNAWVDARAQELDAAAPKCGTCNEAIHPDAMTGTMCACACAAREPVTMRNMGDSEQQFVADAEIACPYCAGSGHRDDVAARLRDPATVHALMLRGAVARPTWRAFVDLMGEVPNGEDAQLRRIAELQYQLAASPEGAQPCSWHAVLSALLDHVDRETCTHEETHRGGAIWTICDSCDRKWADDEGGFVPHEDAPAVAAARALIAAAPEGAQGAVPSDNDGKEQDAFEAWATSAKYDMQTHPLHWLFLNERTYAARDGWRAALRYVAESLTTPPQPQDAARDREDAERYRCLRSTRVNPHAVLPCGDELDAYIDAARSK